MLPIKSVKDLTVGTYVLSLFNGKKCFKKITNVFDNGIQPVFEYTLQNGSVILSTPNQKILQKDGSYLEIQNADYAITKENKIEPIIKKNFIKTEHVYDIEVEDSHNFLLANSNIWVSNSRAGSQTPFSSINYGTGTRPEEQMIIQAILRATDEGLGNHETPIFPVQIFKMKDGINTQEGDPNYPLFKLACQVTAKRLFPNFSFIDSPYNMKSYKKGHPETEYSSMGCRTRVLENYAHPDKTTVLGRGNISFTTINLPRLAIKYGKDIKEHLEKTVQLCIAQLYDRLDFIGNKSAYNFPFLMGEGVWLDSDKLEPNDKIRDVLTHGTLSVGFIGLAECLSCILGSHHGESEEAQKYGLDLISFMRDMMEKEKEKSHLNWSLFASPAEGLSGRFVKIDKLKYGIIKNVTDREYYTNSFHVPVWYKIKAADKLRIEAPYHNLCNAGAISYVEVDGDLTKNPKAVENLVMYMKALGICYGAINHPVDYCPVCGFTGIIHDTCPKCGRRDCEGVPVEKLKELGIKI